MYVYYFNLLNFWIKQILFWGVRDIKKVQFMGANRPQAELDCCYQVKKQTGEDEQVVKSVVVKNAKKNPNFDDSVDIFDVVRFFWFNFYVLAV